MLDQITQDKLNDAANLLLDQIPQAKELTTILAEEHFAPIWKITCGVLLAAHLEGRLSAFYLDPAWEDGLRQKESTCKHCGKTFEPINIAQPYCSNKCGLAATEASLYSVNPPALQTDEPTPEIPETLEEGSKALELLRKKKQPQNDPDTHTTEPMPVGTPIVDGDSGWADVDLAGVD